MSLNQFLEPLPPQQNGLVDVQQRARVRARRARVTTAFASAALPVLVLLLWAGGNFWLGAPEATDSSEVAATCCSGNFNDIHPDATGLPGGANPVTIDWPSVAVAASVIGFALLAASGTWSLLHARHETLPTTRLYGGPLYTLVVAALLFAVAALAAISYYWQ